MRGPQESPGWHRSCQADGRLERPGSRHLRHVQKRQSVSKQWCERAGSMSYNHATTGLAERYRRLADKISPLPEKYDTKEVVTHRQVRSRQRPQYAIAMNPVRLLGSHRHLYQREYKVAAGARAPQQSRASNGHTFAVACAAAHRTGHGMVSIACCSWLTTAIIAGFSLACNAMTCRNTETQLRPEQADVIQC